MRRVLATRLSVLATALVACSDTTIPSPTIAGTWQVTIQSVRTGTLTPLQFDVVITPATESTFNVVMPPIVWSEGPAMYDTLARISSVDNDNPDSTLTFEEFCRSLTCSLTFRARMNPGRDSLVGGLLFVDTITVDGTLYWQTIPGTGGAFVAHK